MSKRLDVHITCLHHLAKISKFTMPLITKNLLLQGISQPQRISLRDASTQGEILSRMLLHAGELNGSWAPRGIRLILTFACQQKVLVSSILAWVRPWPPLWLGGCIAQISLAVVFLCLPWIHFEMDAGITKRRIHYDHHWLLSLEHDSGKQRSVWGKEGGGPYHHTSIFSYYNFL